ncbi:MAG: ATP-binding protein, partial [Aggregatilineales bacterium]
MTIHNLPRQSTPFIGRTIELAEITERLEDPTCRLLTLVSPGGIGKTRLALQVAAQQVGNFGDGVYFVGLASVESPNLLPAAIAGPLAASFYGPEDPAVQIVNYLRDKQTLLLLDNFEHLLEGVDLLADLLAQASEVKLLITSRERVNLQGETIFHVGGMAYPDQAIVEDITEYSAVKLFLDNVHRLRPELLLTNQALADAARICRQVQGMPLAIVLAAAWVDTLSLAEISQELAKSLDFLKVELRNVPERHRGIRAAFDPSGKMLPDEEREVFMRL